MPGDGRPHGLCRGAGEGARELKGGHRDGCGRRRQDNQLRNARAPPPMGGLVAGGLPIAAGFAGPGHRPPPYPGFALPPRRP